MAFWGVEVKPGRPYTHVCDEAKGRLRITHATLGNGSASSAAKRVLLQCNVGNRSPVLLCSLWPDTRDFCPVTLEFEESEEVIFSVIGARSVHLVGFCSGHSYQSRGDNDSESYGEDIADTESEDSGLRDEDNSYEDSFINDDEPEFIPPSPLTIEDEKSNGGNRKRLRKKYKPIESDEEILALDSDDERSLEKNRKHFIKKGKKKGKEEEISKNTREGMNLEVTLPSKEKTRTPEKAADQNVNPELSQVRTFSSGLVITELEPGMADGKVASHGKKVRVHFVGKLKEDDQIFDTNVGEAPMKFRLGGKKVVEGWNIGLEGMRVGGKRKLIIPPSLGYGSEGDGDKVPPNSWLVYDVELVKVR